MQATSLSPRQVDIVERVRTLGFQSTAALAVRFAVTEQTIRRDVNDLCRHGLLRRRHGGVELPAPNLNLGIEQRRILQFAAKDRVARLAASQIPQGASLAVSIGTTPEIVLRHLKHCRGLRVVTNSMAAAMTALGLPEAEVTMAGGRVRPEGWDVLGDQAERMFAAHKVDIGLFGVGGVDGDGCLLDFAEEEIRVRAAIAANCRTRFLVLDHSKFGRPAHVRGGTIADADLVFCDRSPPQPIVAQLAAAGRALLVADAAGGMA
ncbi:MAG: DeoR/GlpR family DNA-binding transcription regulator [Sneathiellaceae bacterium]